jgi:nitrogen fixation/metabolism regulation signal transduction histidine kinase
VNTTELKTYFSFIDGLQVAALLLDSNGHIVKQNEKAKTVEASVFESAEKLLGFKNCLEKSTSAFFCKSTQQEFNMTSVCFEQNLYVMVQVFEKQIGKVNVLDVAAKVASIAHEINNPLTVISVRTQMLHQILSEEGASIGNEKLTQYFEKMSAQADRIKKLVDDMSSYAKGTLAAQEADSAATVALKQVS